MNKTVVDLLSQILVLVLPKNVGKDIIDTVKDAAPSGSGQSE